MSGHDLRSKQLKEKTIHELREFAWVFVYLAFFFCSLELYSLLLLRDYHVKFLNFGFALINALVVAKIILLGEYARIGRKYEKHPLVLSITYKATMFVALVFVFHFIEELVKRFLHTGHFAGAFSQTRVNDILGRGLVVFCTFLPLFAFRELRRVLGERKFVDLLFRSAAANDAPQCEQSRQVS